jgi:hypothetical protein
MTVYDGAELKKRFVESTNFAEFHDYYMSNFIEKGNFMRLGRTLSAPRAEFLNDALAESYGKIAGVSVIALSSQLIEIPELGLIHGAFNINGNVASVLYFDDIAMGMFVVVESGLTGETKFMRFTAIRPARGKPN